jgi:hypothetical protein
MSYGQNGILNTVRYIPKPESTAHPRSKPISFVLTSLQINPFVLTILREARRSQRLPAFFPPASRTILQPIITASLVL